MEQFIPTEVEVHKKKEDKDHSGLKYETVKVEITFTSSGDTSKVTREQIGKYIIENFIMIFKT